MRSEQYARDVRLHLSHPGPGLGAVNASPVSSSDQQFIQIVPLKPATALILTASFWIYDGARGPVILIWL